MMISSRLVTLLCVMLFRSAVTDNATDVCEFDSGVGQWGALLEDWVTTPERPGRQGRILNLPQNKGYYITDRIDLVPPPPAPSTRINTGAHGPPMNMNPTGPTYNYYEPQYYQNNQYNQGFDQTLNNRVGQYALTPQNPTSNQNNPSYSQVPQNSGSFVPAPQNPNGSYPPQNSPNPPHPHSPNAPNDFVSPQEPPQQAPSSATPPGPKPYSEWQGPAPPARPSGGKIVNRPPNKDKFKPSYEYYEKPSQPNKPAPTQPTRPNSVDRVDDPPKRTVSETDLYLLSAIEKLVYRVDLMEKRLRKVEESMHYIVVGQDPKAEPCASNFTRVSGICYHFSQEAVDWKSASISCRRMKSHLLEIDYEGERRMMFSYLLADKKNRGVNWWTGGLNPGLLWIWAHSAAAVVRNSTTTNDNDPPRVSIVGDGRCLALVHDAPAGGFVFKGEECGYRYRYICEKEEDKTTLSNEIQRVSRKLHVTAEKIVDSRRRAKIMWDNDS